MDSPLAFSGVIRLAAAACWLVVGWRLGVRPIVGPGRSAAQAFSLWWMGLGAATVVDAAADFAVALGDGGRFVAVFVAYLKFAFVPLMFWGLMSHLVYLHTGRAALQRAVTIAYLAQGVALLALVAYLNPTGLRSVGASVEIEYARLPGALSDSLLLVALVLPPFVAAIAYAALLRRVEGRTARFRLGVVAGSILVGFAAALASGAASARAPQALALQGLGTICALAVLVAYDPPRWLARRLRVEALRDEAPRPRARPFGRDALPERVREVV